MNTWMNDLYNKKQAAANSGFAAAICLSADRFHRNSIILKDELNDHSSVGISELSVHVAVCVCSRSHIQ